MKNNPLRVVFSTLFSVFGYADETLSLVFDILLETLKSELNEIYSTKGKEEMFRSKVKWVEEGEKKSKYFLVIMRNKL